MSKRRKKTKKRTSFFSVILLVLLLVGAVGIVAKCDGKNDTTTPVVSITITGEDIVF